MTGKTYTDPDGREWIHNGFGLTNGTGFILVFTPPSAEEADAMFRGYKAGYQEGLKIGRSILQNEFRNLMDCQTK